MGELKVAFIGAGSYVFGPSVLAGALVEHDLGSLDLALMDVDREGLDLMAGVGRRIARERAPRARVAAHTDRASALDGADFVVCSAAPEMQKRHEMDCRIIDYYLPGHLVTEFGGIAGMSYSLRQIAFITDLAADIEQHCPRAWLLTVCNPLPRVCQAAHESGVRTVGFCSVGLNGYAMLWRLLRGETIRYPFAQARETFDAVMAGLNHFSWIVEARLRKTGQDVLPAVRLAIEDGISSGNPHAEAVAREAGYLLAPGDGHVQDFLRPFGEPPPRQGTWHGSAEERSRRLALLRDVADGATGWDELLASGAWEKPVDLVAAMVAGESTRFHAVNLVNGGQVPNLPDGVFVETPAAGTPDGPVPQTVPLPETVLPYCQRVARVSDLIVHAALERSRRLLHRAVELDPTIHNASVGAQAIDACLEAHADILPAYA